MSNKYSRIRLSSHRLCVETSIWDRSFSTPINDGKCLTCDVVEDGYQFFLAYT